MCLQAVSTDLNTNSASLSESWLIVFHRNWSRRGSEVKWSNKNPLTGRRLGWMDGSTQRSTVRIIVQSQLWDYFDKSHKAKAVFIFTVQWWFVYNTFLLYHFLQWASFTFCLALTLLGGDVGFTILPTDTLTRRLEQQRFDPPSVCSHPEHTRMWELSRNLCFV